MGFRCHTHYSLRNSKTCILNGKNVFCEKPFTSNLTLSLYEINNVKLYVDDVFNYRVELKELHSVIDTKREIKVMNTSKSH